MNESLPHAVARMRAQGYSNKQIAGQIHQWHAGWTNAHVAASMAVPRNAGPSLEPVKQSTEKETRRYKPAYPGEKPAGREALPDAFRLGGSRGGIPRMSDTPKYRPYYAVKPDSRSNLERAVDRDVTPMLARAPKLASPAITTPANIAGNVLSQLGGGPLLVGAVEHARKRQALPLAMDMAGVLPLGRFARALRGAKAGATALEDAGKVVKAAKAAEEVAPAAEHVAAHVPKGKSPVPPKPGDTPIPANHVRLFHYSDAAPETLRKEGLRIDKARGSTYGEPNAVWASADFPKNAGHERNVVEFSVPHDDPRWDIGKFGGENVNYGSAEAAAHGPEAYAKWLASHKSHVTFRGDIKPSEVVAVHEPWHAHYRYFEDNGLPFEDMAWLGDPEKAKNFPNEARAYREYTKTAAKETATRPRTPDEARALLEEMDQQYEDFIDQFVGSADPKGKVKRPKLSADELAEQKRINTDRGRALNQAAGVTSTGRVAGAKGSNKAVYRKTVNEQKRAEVEAQLDAIMAKNPDHPGAQAYIKTQELRGQLRTALNQHEEQSFLGGDPGAHEPVDFGKVELPPEPESAPTVKLADSVSPRGGYVEKPAVYLRLGEPPSAEGKVVASTNHIGGGSEKGVSVYAAWHDPATGKYVLPSGSEQYLGTQGAISDRPIFEVHGKVLRDVGDDGEPLLDPATVTVRRSVSSDDVVNEQDPWLALSGKEHEPHETPNWMTETAVEPAPHGGFFEDAPPSPPPPKTPSAKTFVNARLPEEAEQLRAVLSGRAAKDALKGMGSYEKAGAKSDKMFGKSAAKAYKEEEKLRAAERAKRFAKGDEVLHDRSLTNEERIAGWKDAVRGELPKISWRGFDELSPDAVKAMTDYALNEAPHLFGHERVRIVETLERAVNGTVPRPHELKLLEATFGKDTATGLARLAVHPYRETIIGVLNVPRTLMSSMDLSAVLRQGLLISVRHPVIAAKNFPEMFRYFGRPLSLKGEEAFQALGHDLKSRANYPLYVKYHLLTGLDHGVGEAEEAFMGANIAEKFTGGKRGLVRASDRAYTGFLDKMRADVFDQLLRDAQNPSGTLLFKGLEPRGIQDEQFMKDLAKVVGNLSGRGRFNSEKLEAAMPLLNVGLFSPRLIASRVMTLNPLYYKKLDPFARREALAAALGTFGAISTVLAMAKMSGAKVETNWRSSDFGKIRVGDSRIDIAGGFQPYFHMLGEIVTREKMSTSTGEVHSLTHPKFGQQTLLGAVGNFARYKLSPLPAVVADYATGESGIGKKFSWTEEAKKSFLPLISQDMKDLYHHPFHGMNGTQAALAGYALEMFGTGVQTYTQDQKGGGGDPFDDFGGGGSGGDPFDGFGGG